ncbi:MAG TPA: hypothetical protein VKY53_00205 [Marinobacter sp.]|nr:hypothetical protein [Marinobacter sp.]
MKFSVIAAGGTRLVFLLLVLALSGCASYYTHYAIFPAENSAGESRQVRVFWDTAEYPGWWLFSDKSTTMKVETQCSERVWRLADDSHDRAADCGEGIRACSDPARDTLPGTGERAPADFACLSVSSPEGAQRISELDGQFSLLVSCAPARRTLDRAGETVNMDYLRPSAVAYTVFARRVARGSLSARLPAFDLSVCKEG